MTKSRHIYIIGPGGGPFKVGIARSVRARLSEIQTGNSAKLEVMHSVQVPGDLALRIERAAHLALRDDRVQGEWFNAPLATVRRAVDAAADTAFQERRDMEAKREAREAAEWEAAVAASTFTVDDVTLVHRVTDAEFFAENAKIQRERAAARAAVAAAQAASQAAVAADHAAAWSEWAQEMQAAKRRKAKAKTAKLDADVAALQAWFTSQSNTR